MSDTTDLLAAAEEALALDKHATPGPWVACNQFGKRSISREGYVYEPLEAIAGHYGVQHKEDADFIARARTLLPILARAVIEGQTAVDTKALLTADEPEVAAASLARLAWETWTREIGASEEHRALGPSPKALSAMRAVVCAVRDIGKPCDATASDAGAGLTLRCVLTDPHPDIPHTCEGMQWRDGEAPRGMMGVRR